MRSSSEAVLQCAHAVMSGLHGLKRTFDCGLGCRIKIGIIERVLELALDVVLAALNFLDDCFVLLASERLLQIHEGAMMDTAVRLAALAAAMSGAELSQIIVKVAATLGLLPEQRAPLDEAAIRLKQLRSDA